MRLRDVRSRVRRLEERLPVPQRVIRFLTWIDPEGRESPIINDLKNLREKTSPDAPVVKTTADVAGTLEVNYGTDQ